MAKRSFPSRLGTFLLAVVMIGLLIVTHRYLVTPDQRIAPIATSGTIGSPVDARGFVMTVGKVRSAKDISQLGTFGDGESETARDVWIVVTATIETSKDRLVPQEPELVNGAGYTYASAGHLTDTLDTTSEVFDPGIPRAGAIAFEVPEKALKAPLSLRMSMAEGPDTRLAPAVDIDLGLDEADVEKLRSSPKPEITIHEPTYR